MTSQSTNTQPGDKHIWLDGEEILASAYQRWSWSALFSRNYRIGPDLLLIPLIFLAGFLAKAEPWWGSAEVAVGALAVWRLLRLALWVIARQPVRVPAWSFALAVWVAAGWVLGKGIDGDLPGHGFRDTASSFVATLLVVFAGWAVGISLVKAFWSRFTADATKDGKKFAAFAMVISVGFIAAWLFFQQTVPPPIPASALSLTGGMAVFVSDASADVMVRVTPNVDKNSVFSPDHVLLDVDPGNASLWLIQLSGGWLAKSAETSDGSDVLLSKGQVLPTKEYGTSVLDSGKTETILALPNPISGFTSSPITWMSSGEHQVLIGSGSQQVDLKLRSKDLILAGSTISAAWPSVGCPDQLNRLLAETYLGKPLPAGVMQYKNTRFAVPQSCDISLGGFNAASDQFPDFASKELTMPNAIGWTVKSHPVSYSNAWKAYAKKQGGSFLKREPMTLGPTDDAGDLSITPRQLRLTSTHVAGSLAAEQALSTGVLGAMVGAAAVLLEQLINPGFRGLFRRRDRPRQIRKNDPAPEPAEPSDELPRSHATKVGLTGALGGAAVAWWALRKRSGA